MYKGSYILFPHLLCWKNIVWNLWAPVCCVDIKKEVNRMTCEGFLDLLHTTNRKRRTLPSSSMSSFVKGQVGISESTYIFGKPR